MGNEYFGNDDDDEDERKRELLTAIVMLLNNDDEQIPGDEAINTIHGYGNDDGFTIVTRRMKRMKTNKVRTIERQPSEMSSNKVSKLSMPVRQNNGVKHQGNRAKAHYI